MVHGSKGSARINAQKIADVMRTVRVEAGEEINPSVLEAECDVLDNQIDDIVCALYGLSADEKKLIVENAVQ
jgi:hypothetical protein